MTADEQARAFGKAHGIYIKDAAHLAEIQRRILAYQTADRPQEKPEP